MHWVDFRFMHTMQIIIVFNLENFISKFGQASAKLLVCNLYKYDFFAFQFPALCAAYYRVITYIGEIYPEKVCTVSTDLFKSMMASVEIGLSSYGADICKLCLELLCSLATEIHNKNLKNTDAYRVLAMFLKVGNVTLYIVPKAG